MQLARVLLSGGCFVLRTNGRILVPIKRYKIRLLLRASFLFARTLWQLAPFGWLAPIGPAC